MIPAAFEYVRPISLGDAVSALASAGEDAKVIAGGQSLLPVLRLRLAAPTVLVDIGRVDRMRGIRVEGDELVVGALTTHGELVASDLVRAHAPLVSLVAATVADRQVRHRGTLGGSLAHADPAGDLGAAALALDATLVAMGPSGRRSIAAQDFFTDVFTTALEPDEILLEVRFPRLSGWTVHYEKFKRTHQAWALVGVAAAVRREGSGIAEARVALTNMGPTPLRARAVEAALAGATDPAAVKAAAAAVAGETSPPSDLSGSAEYRRHLAGVLTARAVCTAAGW
jgi:carbon-monoxide dehydrogenase medium subunit